MGTTPLRILFVTSEVAGLAKTGGLADVSAALPRQLHRLGHDIRVLLPLYRQVRETTQDFTPIESLRGLTVRIGSSNVGYSIVTTKLPGSSLTIGLVDCPALYDRPGIYTSDKDEHLRFLLLTRAALEVSQQTQWSPDIVHWHDWQTGLGPLYLKSTYAWDRLFHPTRSLLTIHNLGYQGVFGTDIASDLTLGDSQHLLHQEDFREGRIGFLKTGLMYADAVSTVSPMYAKEIQTEPLGMGLDGFLRKRGDNLVGILNGVDEAEWDPRTDKSIPSRYSEKSLWRKEKNKESLLHALGLRYEKDVPTVGIISRLTAQKGIELLDPAIPELLRDHDVRFVALGTGEPHYEELLSRIQRGAPGKACFYRGYSNELAHLIEAAADLLIMPSRYEPCGLNQLYSLRYGTVPVVRYTGGLADSVRPFDPSNGSGTGFVFQPFSSGALRRALKLALAVYADRSAWKKLQQAGMACDFSWATQAERYVGLYKSLAPRAEVRV